MRRAGIQAGVAMSLGDSDEIVCGRRLRLLKTSKTWKTLESWGFLPLQLWPSFCSPVAGQGRRQDEVASLSR